ncbi:unnamed protein product, partial [Ectocarpus sp. 13 AM-2016]
MIFFFSTVIRTSNALAHSTKHTQQCTFRTFNQPNKKEFVSTTIVPVPCPVRQTKTEGSTSQPKRGFRPTKRLEGKRYTAVSIHAFPSREPHRLFPLAHATPNSDSTSSLSPLRAGCMIPSAQAPTARGAARKTKTST